MISLQSSPYPQTLDGPVVMTSNQNWYTQFGKRLFDITFSLLVSLLILSWLVPIVGLIILITSPGPALFVQIRTGRRGRPFACLKFRTMYFDRDPAFAQAVKGDIRITRIGRFLRKTNLDEMPQFWNVLMGQMSIVGPRPHALQHDSQYWDVINNYEFRYTVRPGITGLAQVRGARGETDALLKMQHRLKYDLHYMKRQSLWMDICICWQTIMPMLMGRVNAW
jgi:putative colanic acid biosynthesis UDP-glucose lipid carrier transferase